MLDAIAFEAFKILTAPGLACSTYGIEGGKALERSLHGHGISFQSIHTKPACGEELDPSQSVKVTSLQAVLAEF